MPACDSLRIASNWADSVAAALTSEDAWSALDAPASWDAVEVEVTAIFEAGVPAGRFSDQLEVLDRAFRYATRLAETHEDVGALRSRGGRPIPVNDGLTLGDVGPGSIRVPLAVSHRIETALDNNGLRLLLVALALLGGVKTTGIVSDDSDGATHVKVVVTASPDAPPRTDITLLHNGEIVVIHITPTEN